jgi:uncharacterized protein (TIGR02246 family)
MNKADPYEENQIRSLYQQWLDEWNKNNASGMAALVAQEGTIIGFDGSQMKGPAEVNSALGQIFSDHKTAAYIGIVREVRFLAPQVALLRAVVGMVTPGTSDINAAVNAVQTLVTTREQGQWRIALFQNTPAAFHGRPDLSEQLTAELRSALRASPITVNG